MSPVAVIFLIVISTQLEIEPIEESDEAIYKQILLSVRTITMATSPGHNQTKE